jgi:hypothetical protein
MDSTRDYAAGWATAGKNVSETSHPGFNPEKIILLVPKSSY